MKTYTVLIRYRTKSGCNTAYHIVRAENMEEALEKACAERARKRGVIRIDGGHAMVALEFLQ